MGLLQPTSSRAPGSWGHGGLQTLLNSTGLNTSIRSENSFWMLLKRLVSIGALDGGGETSNQNPPWTSILLCPFPLGFPWPARPGCIAGCIAALLARAAIHREGPFAGVTALGLADTLFIQKTHLVVEESTARRPEQGEPPSPSGAQGEAQGHAKLQTHL